MKECDMKKIKFTKASRKDATLVTVALKQFAPTQEDVANDLYFAAVEFEKGEKLVLVIEGVPTIFTVNRKGRTAVTYSLPRFLRLPQVGRPVFAKVTEVFYV